MFALVAARARLRFRPFSSLRRNVLERPTRDLVFGSRRTQTINEVRAAVFWAARRLGWRTTCFERALACLALLRRRGIETQLHYAAASTAAGSSGERVLLGHVWLTDGDVGVIGGRVARGLPRLATLTASRPQRGAVVMVLGPARSGTSAVAAGLSALGVELGPRLRGPAAFNPRGLFEDAEVAAVNRELLRRAGMGAFSPRMGSVRRWATGDFDDLREIARALAVSRFREAPWWGFKDPRTIQTLDFWVPILEDAGYRIHLVLVVRHPARVALSLNQAFRVDPRRALLHWMSATLTALAQALAYPAAVVDYDRLVDDPLPEMKRLADTLGLEWTEERASALNTYGTHFLEPGLRHHRDRFLDGRGSWTLLPCIWLYGLAASWETHPGVRRRTCVTVRTARGILVQAQSLYELLMSKGRKALPSESEAE